MTTFQDRVKQILNEESARESKIMFGYAPDPHCTKCGGFGKVHSIGLDGRTDWAHIEMCNAPGCLLESYNKRSQIGR